MISKEKITKYLRKNRSHIFNSNNGDQFCVTDDKMIKTGHRVLPCSSLEVIEDRRNDTIIDKYTFGKFRCDLEVM